MVQNTVQEGPRVALSLTFLRGDFRIHHYSHRILEGDGRICFCDFCSKSQKTLPPVSMVLKIHGYTDNPGDFREKSAEVTSYKTILSETMWKVGVTKNTDGFVRFLQKSQVR